ncbi:MAG: hypothetical protein ACRCWI_04200 [Brevinema sp.]
MKKYLLITLLLFSNPVFTQESLSSETLTERAFNSTIDQGWYWQNSLRARWNPAGFEYITRIYYRRPLMRNKGSFWFANSALNIGIEHGISSLSKTTAYFFWQPIIALSFTVKASYAYDMIGFAQMSGPDDNYAIALPPFTGLNPMTQKPIYGGNQAFEIEFTPQFTFGGKAGVGMLALIYTPMMLYVHTFGMNQNQYYLNNYYVVVMKAQDIFWQHNIRLGYALIGTGISVAMTGIIEHVQSYSGIVRAGVFGAFSYEKASKRFPTLIPFFRGQIGTWIKDRYMQQYFAFQAETGVIWKFGK